MNVHIYGTVKKTHQFICTMYYVAPETPMMSSVIADCPDLAPPQYFGQVYAYVIIVRWLESFSILILLFVHAICAIYISLQCFSDEQHWFPDSFSMFLLFE